MNDFLLMLNDEYNAKYITSCTLAAHADGNATHGDVVLSANQSRLPPATPMTIKRLISLTVYTSYKFLNLKICASSISPPAPGVCTFATPDQCALTLDVHTTVMCT